MIEGINKRAREDDCEKEYKLTRDRLTTASLRDGESDFTHYRGFSSSLKAYSADDISDDATSTDSKMDLEDVVVDENDLTRSHHGESSDVESNPAVRVDLDSTLEVEEDAINAFVHTMKGGKLQYIRKIDFLVDDLVRKTNRTLNWAGGVNSVLCCIPSAIGPHPGTDIRFLSIDVTENDSKTCCDSYQVKGDHKHPCTGEVSVSAVPTAFSGSDSGYHNELLSQTRTSKLSGDLTHCDWPIEEIP